MARLSFRPRPTIRDRRGAVVREVVTALVIIAGTGTVLALDPAADGSEGLQPAASSAVVPAVLPAAATVGADAPATSPGSTDGALVAAREQAAADAAAELVARQEAQRRAEEQAAAAAAAAQRAAVWDRLADCESGRWDRAKQPVPGSARWSYGLSAGEDGFFQGGLQFHPVTWDEFRDADMPDHAGQATREVQIAVAERVLEVQGWEAWPVCSRKLGYR